MVTNQSTNRNRRHAILSRYILMPVSMLVKCEKCGYENFPQHRFCGMCAAELRLPDPGGVQPAPAPRRVPAPSIPPPKEKEVVPQQVSGPSFLSLGNERADSKSVSYLLEEEEPPSHRVRNLILILLIAAVAAAAWHWRQDLRVVSDGLLNRAAPAASSNSSDNQAPNSSSTASSDSTSGAAPANNANAGSQVEKVVPGAGDSNNDQAAGAQAQTPSSVVAPAGAADSTPSPQTNQSPISSAPQASDSAANAAAKADDAEEAASQPAPTRKASKASPQPATAPAIQARDLEAEGEKYLYGNGVPENCTRARTNLLAAAQHSNAQAQNVLGTMYATGHCATRDLPTAYRWFSRSLRKDPSNTRIEQDLKVLWNQMTPEERQLALSDTR
jgi:cytoskeletal protein RodZ